MRDHDAPPLVVYGMNAEVNIDTVLADAQNAVASLAQDVDRLSSPAPDAASSPKSAVAAVDAGPHRPDALKCGIDAADSTPMLARDPRVRRILKLRVPVSVRVAERQWPLSEILKIVPGTIIEFSRGVSQELDLLVGGRQIGRGVAVKAGERFGLRITRIAELRRRIQSLTCEAESHA